MAVLRCSLFLFLFFLFERAKERERKRETEGCIFFPLDFKSLFHVRENFGLQGKIQIKRKIKKGKLVCSWFLLSSCVYIYIYFFLFLRGKNNDCLLGVSHGKENVSCLLGKKGEKEEGRGRERRGKKVRLSECEKVE